MPDYSFQDVKTELTQQNQMIRNGLVPYFPDAKSMQAYKPSRDDELP